MPKLSPFPAIRYATDDGEITTRIAPPYDVLDEGPKQELLAEDPHNIVAVDLPVTPPKTVGPDAAYAAAGETMRQWLEAGVLVRDEAPSVTVYEQRYELDGQTKSRVGLIAAVGVEAFNRPGGGVFRHEQTIQGGINDRYKLMEATRAQLSPVFGVYSDQSGEVRERLSAIRADRNPLHHGRTTHDGVEHRSWRVDDDQLIGGLIEHFRGTDVFIADGHHRYTTALQFHRDHPDLPGAAGCLFVLVAAEDPGMVVLPTHRVFTGLDGLTGDRVLAAIDASDGFRLTNGPGRFSLYDPATGTSHGIDTVGDDPLADHLPDRPEVWRRLDVAILHAGLVDRVLRPLVAAAGGEADAIGFKYTPDPGEMRRLAEAEHAAGRGAVGIEVAATPLASVMAVSHAGDVMPPKSTFFYPKVATGFVVAPLG